MILLQDGLLSTTQVLSVFLSLALTLVSFFLREFYVMVKAMMIKIENAMITNIKHGERLDSIEEDVAEMKLDIKKHYMRKDA